MGVFLDTSKFLISMSDCSSGSFYSPFHFILFFLIHYSPSDFYYTCLSSSLLHLKTGLFFHTRLTSHCPFTLLPSQAYHSSISLTCSLGLTDRVLTSFHSMQDPQNQDPVSLFLATSPLPAIYQPTAPILSYPHAP